MTAYLAAHLSDAGIAIAVLVLAFLLTFAACLCAVSGSANAEGDRLARERGRKG